ncbi:hypothetical protein ABZ890_45385 [Streptomyces sp. NPDC046984]|uniref:hypothetical protein n=1 Tax=Streptomyces sp. NPDC046984 TaxID=3155138 RepID=UPI0033D16D7A
MNALEKDEVLGKHGPCVIRAGVQRFPHQDDWDRCQAETKGDSDPVISVERPELLIESKAERCQDPAFTDINRQRVEVTWRIDERRADDLAIDCSVP